LLQGIYGEIITTPEVAEEFGEKLPEWINVQYVADKKYQDIIEIQMDKGEASAIALAKEYDDVLLLLDDLKARKLAFKLDLKFTGTLGIIHKAKQEGLIKKAKPLIEKILRTNFRISDKIIYEILRLNEEQDN